MPDTHCPEKRCVTGSFIPIMADETPQKQTLCNFALRRDPEPEIYCGSCLSQRSRAHWLIKLSVADFKAEPSTRS